MELGGKVGWSDPIPMVGQYTGNIAIPVVQALIPEGSTEPVGATFISVGLAQVHSRLRALPIGSRGVALFVTSSGELLSSSVPGIEALRSPTAIRLWANDSALSAYPVVQAMLHRLRGWDLVGSTASNAIFEGCVYTDAALVNDRPCPVLHADLDVDGDEYRILGAPLRIPGMNGTIAIAALKSEFDGGLSSQIKRSLTYAAIVLSVATLLTFLIAFCVTRPFRRMAWFFSELSAMLAKSSASLNKRGSVSPFNATDRIGPPKPRSSDHIGIVATESDELMGMNGRPQSQQSLVLHHDILVPIEERQPTCLSLCFPPADFSSAIDEVRMMQDSYQQLLDGIMFAPKLLPGSCAHLDWFLRTVCCRLVQVSH